MEWLDTASKNQSYVMSIATDSEGTSKYFELLYFVGDTCGLEQFIMQNNILIECRRLINQCA